MSTFFRYVEISQNWTDPKINEISYTLLDIFNILGYSDLISDISSV